jgi:hypothetical protein
LKGEIEKKLLILDAGKRRKKEKRRKEKGALPFSFLSLLYLTTIRLVLLPSDVESLSR